MRHQVLALTVAALLLSAGCFTGAPESSPDGESATPPSTDASPTPSPAGTSVEYTVRAGTVPDTFESVNVTLQVVFVDRTGDLGPCYSEVYSGPYKPTITPVATPSGECHRLEPITIDLTELEGERPLGTFTAPGSTNGHALIVTTVRATYQNETVVSKIKGTRGEILIEAPNPPAGQYGIQLGIEPAPEEAPYDYWLLSKQFDPSD